MFAVLKGLNVHEKTSENESIPWSRKAHSMEMWYGGLQRGSAFMSHRASCCWYVFPEALCDVYVSKKSSGDLRAPNKGTESQSLKLKN